MQYENPDQAPSGSPTPAGRPWQRRLFRWAIRIAIAVAILSTIGYFSNPSVSPLMCKIYG